MIKRIIATAAALCLLALSGCGDSDSSDKSSKSADSVSSVSAPDSSKTETTTTTTVPEESSVSEDTSQTTTIKPDESSAPETTADTEHKTESIPGLSQEDQAYADDFMAEWDITADDFILEKPDDMSIREYMLYMRYLKKYGKTGHFSKTNEKPDSSCYVPNNTFIEENVDYKDFWTADAVYDLCTYDDVKNISKKRYDELDLYKDFKWFGYFKTDEYTAAWLKECEESLGTQNNNLDENGEYFIVFWPEANWEKWVNYWLILDN